MKREDTPTPGSAPVPHQASYHTFGAVFKQVVIKGKIGLEHAWKLPGQPAFVPFSTRHDYEPIAQARVDKNGARPLLSAQETDVIMGGLFRVNVSQDVPLVLWTAPQDKKSLAYDYEAGLRLKAMAAGSDPSHWYRCFQPVDRNQWLSVERWVNSGWTIVDPKIWNPPIPTIHYVELSLGLAAAKQVVAENRINW